MVRRGVDTNVLVYLHMPSLPEHTQVRRYLLGQLRRPDVRLVLTPHILHEFIHTITDSRRFEPAVSMAEAVAIARLYLGRPNVEMLASDDACLILALQWLENFGLGRKRIADTLFAATLVHYGVEELITSNGDDFKIFPKLRLIDPRTTPAEVT